MWYVKKIRVFNFEVGFVASTMITKKIPLKNMEISKEKNIKVTLKFLNFVYMCKFSKKKPVWPNGWVFI